MYANPFHSFQDVLSADEPITSQSIKRLKRRLFAEFELEDALSIQVGSQQLDKDGVLKLIDSLEDTKVLEYHRKIYQSNALCNFLETGEERAALRARIELQQFQENEGYEDFVLTELSKRFDHEFAQALKELNHRRVRRLRKLMNRCLKQEYLDIALRSANRFMLREINAIESLQYELHQAEEAKEWNREKLQADVITWRPRLINALPKPYFVEGREKLASSLMSLSLVLFNRGSQHSAWRYALKKAIWLNVKMETSNQASHTKDWLNAKVNRFDLYKALPDGSLKIRPSMLLAYVLIGMIVMGGIFSTMEPSHRVNLQDLPRIPTYQYQFEPGSLIDDSLRQAEFLDENFTKSLEEGMRRTDSLLKEMKASQKRNDSILQALQQAGSVPALASVEPDSQQLAAKAWSESMRKVLEAREVKLDSIRAARDSSN